MGKNYEILMCDCEYFDPPCRYCESDPIVAARVAGQTKYIRKSEAIALEKKS